MRRKGHKKRLIKQKYSPTKTEKKRKESTMIDGRQIRAARAMLGWSREDLLQASGISMSALLRMEGALADSRSSTLNKVVKALSLAGIEFVTRDDGAIGVILKAEQAKASQGN
jgi:transcriptional regulator with XRE-family HTH domain